MTDVATAPGKLILTGEYAVLDGAPALVVAVNRRATARMRMGSPAGSSPFLIAVASELAERGNEIAARAAMEVVVDSSDFYAGGEKLGLGSSAAVTVAATALALSVSGDDTRGHILEVAMAAHANAQAERGARGSGADIAAAVHGGAIKFHAGRAFPLPRALAGITLVPFFTGVPADTATLIARVQAARAGNKVEVDAALEAIADASSAAVGAMASRVAGIAVATIGAFSLAATAMERLAAATGLPLVPECVSAARQAMSVFGGTAKTTGAGGGDIGVAVLPSSADLDAATRALVTCGCVPLSLSVDDVGVDLRPAAS